jgi:hypothetical protein
MADEANDKATSSKTQGKISIPKEEWQLVIDYYKEHKQELKLKGIKSPTMLLRRWMLEKYEENTSHESKK